MVLNKETAPVITEESRTVSDEIIEKVKLFNSALGFDKEDELPNETYEEYKLRKASEPPKPNK